MTSISKNVYIDKLADIVNEYNNTRHSTIKMKLVDVKSSTHIDFNVEKTDEDSKFKVSYHARILRHENIFAELYTPKWLEEIFVIKKFKNTVSWIYVTGDINGEEIVGTFYEKEFQKKSNQFRAEKVLKKGDKLYVK